MKYAMNNGSQSVSPLKWNELSDVKSAVICVIIVLNVILNSLVIAVIIRYPQLREDRTTLFMFSLSVSDLAGGCTFMPISAALCSGKLQGVIDEVGFLQKTHAFPRWWFGYNSIHKLCWLTISKAIVILKPFKVEQFLTRTRCYTIIGINWIIGCLLAMGNFTVNLTWNSVSCSYSMQKDRYVKASRMVSVVLALGLPTTEVWIV